MAPALSPRLMVVALVALFVHVGWADAQIRLQSPKRLFDKLVATKAISEETFYTLIGSTASFGTPAYGTTLRYIVIFRSIVLHSLSPWCAMQACRDPVARLVQDAQ